MRLAGTGPILHDEHGAYRMLITCGVGVPRIMLRWNGERWAKSDAPHDDLLGGLKTAVADAIRRYTDAGYIVSPTSTPLTFNLTNNRFTVTSIAGWRVV